MTISLQKLSVSYGEKLIVDDFSIEAKSGEIVAMIAPSGAGKTTTLLAICGLLPEEANYSMSKFEFFGNNFDFFRRYSAVSFVLQNPMFFEWQTIRESIVRFQELSKSESIDIDGVLESLNISGIGDMRPSQLSRGMLYRASLARAMSINSKLLLLDESFSNIDEIQKAKCLESVKNWVRQRGAICLFVTHQIADAASLADRIMILSGTPLRSLKALEIEENPFIRPIELCAPIIQEIRDTIKRDWVLC